MTAEALAHFRNLLLVKTAPGQEDLLDIQADGYEQLRVQAEKFTPRRDRSRALPAARGAERHALDHVAAALPRARAGARHDPRDRPEPRRRRRPPRTPRTPGEPRRGIRFRRSGRAARRTRRLFRSSLLRSSGPQGRRLPTHRPPSTPGGGRRRRAAEGGVARRGDPEQRSREAASTGMSPRARPRPSLPSPTPRACSAGARGRRRERRRRDAPPGVAALMEHLQSTRQMILKASLESATVATYDGETLELAFPPDEEVHGREGRGQDGRAAAGARRSVRDPARDRVRGARGARPGRGADAARDRRRRGSAVGRGGAPPRAGDVRRAGHGRRRPSPGTSAWRTKDRSRS